MRSSFPARPAIALTASRLVSAMRRGVARPFLVALISAAVLGFAAIAPVRAASDFQLLVTPSSLLLPPGGSVSFLISVGSVPVGDFTDPVLLSVDPLPAGVTSQLSTDTVTPPGTARLTLIASENAAVGTFDIVVRGVSGAIHHDATGSVTVDFGLVPICYASVEGTVTDRETGAPIEGVGVTFSNIATDANGHYTAEHFGLGENNSPIEISGYASKFGYWQSTLQQGTLVCDQVTHINFTLLKWEPAHLHGIVVEGTTDPNDPNVVIPGDTPLGGVGVGIESFVGSGGFDTSAAEGTFGFDLGHLGFENAPLTGTALSAFLDGYWVRNSSTPSPIPVGDIAPGDDPAVLIGLVRQCTSEISGIVTYGDTKSPVAGARVRAFVPPGLYTATVTTDANGVYDFTQVLLGYNNVPTDVFLDTSVDTGFYLPASGQTHFDGCGEHKLVSLVLPAVKFGAVQGHVTDVETGLPLAGVSVSFPDIECKTCDPYPAVTDADGAYRISRVPVDPDPTQYAIRASNDPDYFFEQSTVDVGIGPPATHDFQLLRIQYRYASLSGTVRDAITGDPIEGAGGGASNGISTTTDALGHYSQTHLLLGDQNAPTNVDVPVSFAKVGYWPASRVVTLSADTPATADLELLPICSGATVSGTVVDATTQLPIEGAQVYTGGGLGVTDAAGRYRIENVPVGVNNSPLSVQVTATKEGYFSQSKQITVFCGASISIDFGPKPPTGSIEGFVTNQVTGNPLADVFIGSEFGPSTTTDASGYYRFDDVPVNPDGSGRIWHLTAIPAGFVSQTKLATVRANETARLDFAFGAVTSDTGSLKISKTLDVGGSSFDPSTTFSIGYDCGGGVSGTVQLAGGANTPINAIPTGSICTVSEPSTPASPPGYSWRTLITGSPTAAIAKDTIVSVTVANSLTRDTGSLKISKTLDVGGSSFDPSTTFGIGYDCGGGVSGTVQLAGGASTTTNAIPTGSICTVSEPSTPASPAGYSWSTLITGSPTAAIAKDVTEAVTVANTLTRDTGSLKITKTLNNPDGASGLPATYVIGYDCGVGHTGNVLVSPGDPSGQTVTGIPTGTQCTVTEPPSSTPAVTNFTWATTIGPNNGVVGINSATTPVDVTVANSITRDRGSLQILKSVSGAVSGFHATFKFTIACSGLTGNYAASIAYPAGASATVSGIPAGAICTVQETLPAAPNGQSWGTPTYAPSNGQVTIGRGTTATVAVRNFLTLKSGALTIGFWQNKNGQAVIAGGASTDSVCNSGTWLFQFKPFQDLPHNSVPLSTATCAQMATYVFNVIKAGGSSGTSMNPMLKAQMLATALDVYFSDPALGGNRIGAPAQIGGLTIDLTKICKMTDGSNGSAKCGGTYSDVSAAFGGAPSLTVMQMLSYAASQSNVGGSTWYANVKSTQEMAKNAFDAINNTCAFAP
jgi:hypothetical protein